MPGGAFVPSVGPYPGLIFLFCDVTNVVVGVTFSCEETEIVYIHAHVILDDCFAGFDLVPTFVEFAVWEDVPCSSVTYPVYD